MFTKCLKNMFKSKQRNAETSKKNHNRIKFVSICFILLTLMILLSPVTLAEESDAINLAFTSDVHGETGNLATWIDKLHNDVSTLDRMIFGGDYPNRMNDGASWSTAQECVNVVRTAYGADIPCVLVQGNHDSQFSSNFDKGLVYDADYAVYAMDPSASGYSSWSFNKSDINKLAEELQDIGGSKPVFVVSHFPIHFCKGNQFGDREVGYADDLLTVLNDHENVIFLWGHNHTIGDPYYGSVMTKGFKIKTRSSGPEQTINFTYLAHGSMMDGNNGAYGLLASMRNESDGWQIDFSYRNLSGKVVSGGSVFIEDQTSPEIKSVAITGITAPKTGRTPDTSAETLSDRYTLSEVSWRPADSIFAADTAYTAIITLTPKTSYYFTESTIATINGNNASKVIPNDDNSLTVEYTFPETKTNTGIIYELADSLENGETYVIVAKSGDEYFALNNSVANTNFLEGKPVTVQGNELTASSVTGSAMLWTAEEASKYMYLTNDGKYLKRESGPTGMLNTSEIIPGEGYGEWQYDYNECKLYTISTSSQGPGTEYLLFYKSDEPSYFQAKSSGSSTSIYIYKLINISPGEEEPINNVEITEIATPKTGKAPDISAETSSNKYTISEVSWNPGHSPFEPDTVYTVSLTLTAKTNYKFTASTEATVNGKSATNVMLNGDGTLTITYEFPKTTPVSEITYQLANELTAGETYVIVDKSGSNYYALNNSVVNGDYLEGISVTVEDDTVTASDVLDSMLWTAEAGNEYMYLINDNKYLQRVSGKDNLYASSDKPDDYVYVEWQYDANAKRLYTISKQSNQYKYSLLYRIGSSSNYFKVDSSADNTNIYLYKLVAIPKTLTEISITKLPDKLLYIEGESFNPAGMEVTAHYNNGTTEVVTDYTYAPTGGLTTADNKITVTYGDKTADVEICVAAKTLTGIRISKPPEKTLYIEGESFNPAGMEVTAHYNNGTTEVVTDYTYAPTGGLTTFDTKITVIYGYKTADVEICVAAKTLTGISISKPPEKTSYIEGEIFNPAGMEVTAHYNNGTSQKVTGYTYSPTGGLTISDTKITVTYSDKTAEVKITVTEAAKTLTGISISKQPTKTSYIEGESFNPAGMEVTAHYDNGTTEVVTGYTYTPTGGLTTSDTKITVTYGGKTAEAEITVKPAASTGGGTGGGGGGSGGSGSGGKKDTVIPEPDVPKADAYSGFNDVPENAWYYEPVKFVVMEGIFKGISNDMFGPDITITRGMFVTILSRLEFGSDDKVPSGNSIFTDLTQDWYKNAVAWAYQNKIVLGITDTEFDPDSILTREQMAVLLYRYAQYKGYDISFDEGALNVFTDGGSVSNYARAGMMWSIKNGLITGVSENALGPQDPATRAQCSVIFMRLVSIMN